MLNRSFTRLAQHYLTLHLPDYIELLHPDLEKMIDWGKPYQSLELNSNVSDLLLAFKLNFLPNHPYNGIYIYWFFGNTSHIISLEKVTNHLVQLYHQHKLKFKVCLLLNTDLPYQALFLKQVRELENQFNLSFHCVFTRDIYLNKRLANLCTPLLEILIKALENEANRQAYQRLEKMLSVLPLTFSDLNLLNEMLQLI